MDHDPSLDVLLELHEQVLRPRSGPSGKSLPTLDHRHRLKTVRPYEYKDAATLLADFWSAVDNVLREKGIVP